MPIVTGRALKEMIKNVSHLVQFTLLRSVKKSPSDPVIATRSKPIATKNDVLPSADVNAPSDLSSFSVTSAPGPRIEQPVSHVGQGGPSRQSSSAKIVLMTNKRSPYLGLLELLGDLIDGDTLPELVTIMAEPDAPEARALISAMRNRIERRLTDEGLSQDVAAARACQVEQGIGEAWTALHRPKGRTTTGHRPRARRRRLSRRHSCEEPVRQAALCATRAFMSLLSEVLPLQLQNDRDNPVAITQVVHLVVETREQADAVVHVPALINGTGEPTG